MELYEPREDSLLLKNQIKKYAKGRVLDMGTGTGIQILEAADKSEIALGVDINPDAIMYCRINHQGIEFRESDLFSNVNGRFDLIIFNPPYLPNEPKAPDIALDGGPKGYELIERFLKQAKDYLKEGGVILLLFSSLTNKKKVEKILEEEKYLYKEIAKKHIEFEDLYVYEITWIRNF